VGDVNVTQAIEQSIIKLSEIDMGEIDTMKFNKPGIDTVLDNVFGRKYQVKQSQNAFSSRVEGLRYGQAL